jgi:CubicO group peptidase (beta-lactamase class C family)
VNRWIALLAGVAVTLSAPVAAQDAAGNWFGTLQVNESVSLPLVVHITRNDAGVWAGTMDSPTQGAMGLPLADIAVEADRLTFKVPVVMGTYQGTWNAQDKTWQGEWSQGAMTWPLALGAPPPPAPMPADWQVPTNEEISQLIATRIAPRRGEGLVVGVVEPSGTRVIAAGPEGGAAFGANTLFEIGSMSKVFTALLLADMANKGEVALDDPAEKYLPAGHHMPERGGRKITLADLSQHRSGLPRLPDNMPFADPDDPYADYSEALMLQFLDRYELPRDIGSQWEYSNLGVGLLGYLLGRAAGSDYETLLRQRITGPLGMTDTAVTLTPEQRARLAPGFDAFMRPAKPWNLPTLMGAGGIRSTAGDMIKFAAAVLDPNSPIAAAVKTTLAVRGETPRPNAEQALGWQVLHPEPGRELLFHEGGTGGFRTIMGFDPAKQRAVIALANSAAEPSTSDLAGHVLVGQPILPTPPVPPAPPPRTAHTEIALPAAELDKFVGRYDFGNGVVFAATRDGDRLMAQRQGSVTGPALQIFPEAPLRFFWKAVDAEVTFTTDASGKVTGAVFTQAGQSLTGQRVEP